ncbi:hypothetical protein Tco_0115109 [Tanacetum coccineum]
MDVDLCGGNLWGCDGPMKGVLADVCWAIWRHVRGWSSGVKDMCSGCGAQMGEAKTTSTPTSPTSQAQVTYVSESVSYSKFEAKTFKVNEELRKGCWWEIVRRRPTAAIKDHMISSYDVLIIQNIRVKSFTMKMEILLEPTLNKLMVERLYTLAGNPVKEILLKLNLPDLRLLLDANEASSILITRKNYSTSVLNDVGWLRSSVARERFHDDRYGCLFRHSGSVETQGESSSRSSLQKYAGTRNVGCIDFIDQGELLSYSIEQKRKCSNSFQQRIRSCAADCLLPAHGMVIANARSNSVRGKDRRKLFVKKLPVVKVHVVHGNTLTATIILNEIPKDIGEVFMTRAKSKLRRAIVVTYHVAKLEF